MKLLRKAWYLIPVTLVVGLSGCTDLPTASDLSDPTSSDELVALEWRDPLAEDIVARQVIGPAGGVIELEGTGATIHFPEGAVSESALMEVRALQGSAVAFEFELPGFTFDVPIEVRIESEALAGQWSGVLSVLVEGDSASEATLPPAGVPAARVRFNGDDGNPDGRASFRVELFGHAVASG